MTTQSNAGLLSAARVGLTDEVWAYLVGGAGSEATLRRNRLALDELAFVPRVLRDVSTIDAATTAFGRAVRLPVALAPVGTLEVFHPDGVEGVGLAAARRGVLHVVGAVGVAPEALEDLAAGPSALQVHPDDPGRQRGVIEAAEAAGMSAIVLTVDVAVQARRERQMAAPLSIPGKRPPDRDRLARATWADLEAIRRLTSLPLVLKGIQAPADARRGIDSGVDGIWVSNHGGRQLDHGRGAVDALEEVVGTVGGAATIIVDGGIQTGSDVLKAIAIGADLVAIGKLQCLALAAGGSSGVESMLEVLEDEIISQMGLLGARSLEDVTSDVVRRDRPSGLPDPSDAWSHLR